MDTVTLTFDIYIRATPEQVWHALTDPAIVPRWRFGRSIETDWRPGSRLISKSPDGEGTVLEAEPGRSLRYNWTQADNPQANGGHPSTVGFDLSRKGKTVTRLTASHRDLAASGAFLAVVRPGWPMMLSGLKSLLETGEPLQYG